MVARVEPAVPDRAAQSSFVERVWIAVAAGTAVAVAGLLLVFAINALLVIFAGVLLGVVLERLSRLVSRTGLSYHLSFGVVVLVLLVVIIATGWVLGARIAARVDMLTQQLLSARDFIEQQLSQYAWGRTVLTNLPSLQQLVSGGWSFSGLNAMFSSVTGIFTTGLVLIIFGLFFAAEPGLYKQGMLRLIPKAGRERASQVLTKLAEALWRWTLGRLASMAIIAVGASIGLMFLNVPLPVTLGVFAGLISFIPNVGGIVGAVVPAVLAFKQGPATMAYVLILFAVLQAIESNLITPIIQERGVSVPPGLLLSGQLLMGVLTGLLGLAMATPLVAVLVVLVREIYVVDILDDPEGRIEFGTEHRSREPSATSA